MKRYRFVVIVAVTLMVVPVVSASSFGSFSSDETKEIDSLRTGFSINAFNMGDQPLELEITSESVEDVRILHPERMTLEPATITSNPESDAEWFLLQDGKYVETTQVPIDVIIDDTRSGNRFEFDVNIRAWTKNSDDSSSGAEQNVAQVRTYSYEVVTTAPRSPEQADVNTGGQQDADQQGSFQSISGAAEQASGAIAGGISQGVDAVTGSFGGSDSTDTGGSGAEAGSDTGSDSDTGESKAESEFSGELERTERPSTNQEENKATGGFFQAGGVNSVTAMLMMAMLLSTVYLLKVM